MSVRSEFTVHMLNDEGKAHAVDLAEGFSTLLDSIEAMQVDPRCFALARTHLQEACFWAKRGMAMTHGHADPIGTFDPVPAR